MKLHFADVRIVRKGVLVILLGFAFITSTWECYTSFNTWKMQKGLDDVSIWERRMLPLKKALPPNANVVGYISDDQDVEFILTQYSLIPIIVRSGTDEKWIIANFNHHDLPANLGQQIGNYSIQSFGDGIYLIQRK